MHPRGTAAVGLLLLFVLSGCKSHVAREAFPATDDVLLAGFRAGESPTVQAYDNLFLYFVQGFESFRTLAGSMANFPGLPSRHGAIADGMEGFARMAPMWGAWVSSGRPAVLTLPGGQIVDLRELFRRGILSGTQPNSPGYWGSIPYFDNQRIVEASDIALSLWLFRDTTCKSILTFSQETGFSVVIPG